MLLLLLLGAAAALDARLPDTSGIRGDLTASLRVDRFFSLWLVFNNHDAAPSDEPFTIFAPRNNNNSLTEGDQLLTHPDLVKKLLLDHIVLGVKLDLNLSSDLSVSTLGGRTVRFRRVNGTLFANNAIVEESRVDVPNGILVVLNDYLFPEDLAVDSGTTQQPGIAEPETSKVESLVKISVENSASRPGNNNNSTFLENVSEVLSFLKSGVRVFRDFLSRSNVSQLINEGEEYTVLVPTDHAFQRWHPIDWGFYPFSVPEFTENIIINHFVKGNLQQKDILNGQKFLTLGGREIEFYNDPNGYLTVNGAPVIHGDTPVVGGNVLFISEVLFVNDGIVQRLHQENRDKETPPLLAFPWFGSQFLSHAFLALEEKEQFSHITRFVNLADLAPHITGAGYTFFVPTDEAFRTLGIDTMPNNYLSNGEGFQVLLNHFVKGRLYKRDLTDGKTLTTLGNKTIHVRRQEDNITVNGADIVESEVFVYNLGTMYYINRVLFLKKEDIPIPTETTSTTEADPWSTVTPADVERIPTDFSEITSDDITSPETLEDFGTSDDPEGFSTSESNDLLGEEGDSRIEAINSNFPTGVNSTFSSHNESEPRR